MASTVKTTEILDKKQISPIKWEDGNYLGVTVCVTEACNLKCSYCYMVGKNNFHRMSWDTAKKCIDFLLNDPYCTGLTDNLMLEFIGGEPLLEIELIDKICDYILMSMYKTNHKWLDNFQISFSTNGTLYDTPSVRTFVKKNKGHVGFGFSMDGSKEKHDLSRKMVNGQGSYDLALEGFKAYYEDFEGDVSQKSTFSSDDLKYLKDSIVHLWDLGFKDVQSNLVYEDVWKEEDPELFENQLVELSDYMFESGRYKDHTVAYLSKRIGLPVSRELKNINRCGAGYKSLAFDTEGNIYPCIRFLDFCSEDRKKKIVGNVNTGINYNVLRALCATTWDAVSPQKCINCEVGNDCGWCIAHNYDQKGTLYERTVDICDMHKANARAAHYYWKKWEQITGKTSERTLEKVLRMDHDSLKYLYFITSNDAPAFCNYDVVSDKEHDESKMTDELYKQGLEFCMEHELLPIFLGKYPIDLDPKKKVFFEIDAPRQFMVPSRSITVIERKNKNLPITTPVVNYRIDHTDIVTLNEDITFLSKTAKRINLFIKDMQKWSEEDFNNYQAALQGVSQIVIDQYSEHDFSLQINILTDRLFSGDIAKDCRAGINSVALAPNGKFYICPAFFMTNPEMCIGSIDKGIDETKKNHYFRNASAICNSCNALACQRCLHDSVLTTEEICVPSANQCRISYIQANAQKELSDKMTQIFGERYRFAKNLPFLQYIDYVADKIYKDERARAIKWLY